MKSKTIKTTIMSFLVVGAMFLPMNSAKAQSPTGIVVIANKSFTANSLSQSEVKRIFQKTMQRYKGKKVVPIHARKSSPLRAAFTQKVLGMTLADEQSYWQNQMVRSGVTPPPELTNTLRAVYSSKTGVSYCYKKDFNPAVAKILLEI